MVTDSWFCMQLIPFLLTFFYSKTYHHTYKSTSKTKNYGKVLRFQSENGIEYTIYIVKLVSVLFCLQTVFKNVVLNANTTVFQ